MMKKIALVTGASSGIGKAAAMMLAQNGFSVYGCARSVDKMKELEQQGVHTMFLDVTDEKSIGKCISEIISAEGRIDVLVNNAGYGVYGAVEDVPEDEAKRQFDVNVFGLGAMMKAVTPYMRAQKSGRIINIASIAGKVCVPFGGWYHSSKYAVEGLSDCARMELRKFGIHISIIQPGLIVTGWDGIASKNLRKFSANGISAYTADAEKVASLMDLAYPSKKTSSERAGSERAGSERTGSERAGSEGAGSEGTGSEGAGSEGTGSEGAGSERTGSEGAGSERTGSERTGSEGAGINGVGIKRSQRPEIVAKAILRAATASHPKRRYTIGYLGKAAVIFHAILPAGIWDCAIKMLQR